MAEESKIFDAFVEFSTRGDVAPEVQKQQAAVAALNQKVESQSEAAMNAQQQRDAAMTKAYVGNARERERADQRAATVAQAATKGKTVDPANWDWEGRQDQQRTAHTSQQEARAKTTWTPAPERADIRNLNKRREEEYGLEQFLRNRKLMERAEKESAAAPKQLTSENIQTKNRRADEQYALKQHIANLQSRKAAAKEEEAAERQATTIADKRDQKDKAAIQQKKTNQLLAINQIAQATRGIPGAGTAASIAAGGVQGGPAGAAAAAVIAGANYGMEGARKASPQDAAKLDYELERLQAIVGRDFVPVIATFSKAVEKLGDFMGGKGSQLNLPQFSNFKDIRDRLQIEALGGMSNTSRSIAGLMGGTFGAGIGFSAGPSGMAGGYAIGSRIGRSIANALD